MAYVLGKKYSLAASLLHPAFAESQARLGKDDESSLWLLFVLRVLNVRQEKWSVAIEQLSGALERAKITFGEADKITFRFTCNLAVACLFNGEKEKASRWYGEALGASERGCGSESEEIGHCCVWLGEGYYRVQKYTDAEVLLKRAILIIEKTCGIDHAHTSDVMFRLAFCISAQCKYEEAEAMYRRALVSAEASMGPKHEHVCWIMAGLADTLISQQRIGEAEIFLTRVLLRREELLGPLDEKTLETLAKLAYCLQSQGKIQVAQEMYSRTYLGRRNTLGEGHADTIWAKTNLDAPQASLPPHPYTRRLG